MLDHGCIDAMMTDAADRLEIVADYLEAAGKTKSMEGRQWQESARPRWAAGA